VFPSSKEMNLSNIYNSMKTTSGAEEYSKGVIWYRQRGDE